VWLGDIGGAEDVRLGEFGTGAEGCFKGRECCGRSTGKVSPWFSAIWEGSGEVSPWFGVIWENTPV